MTWQNAALAAAALIGGGVAIVHGILTQRLMVRPVASLLTTDRRISGTIRRLVPLLLHFSTFVWFGGGLALIAAATWLDRDTRFAVAVLVGATYLQPLISYIPTPGGDSSLGGAWAATLRITVLF